MANVSRRNFLKGAAAGSVSAAALGLLGGYAPTGVSTKAFADEGEAAAESSWKIAPEPVAEDAIVATYEADAIVIGHGHAGITACREIAEEGKKVILIEKQSEEYYMPNGNEGGVVNNTYLLEKQNQTYIDPIEFFNNWQMITGNTTNPALIMKYCQNSQANSDWYVDGLTEEQLDTVFVGFCNVDNGDIFLPDGTRIE